jgi:hypothetical protein
MEIELQIAVLIFCHSPNRVSTLNVTQYYYY